MSGERLLTRAKSKHSLTTGNQRRQAASDPPPRSKAGQVLLTLAPGPSFSDFFCHFTLMVPILFPYPRPLSVAGVPLPCGDAQRMGRRARRLAPARLGRASALGWPSAWESIRAPVYREIATT